MLVLPLKLFLTSCSSKIPLAHIKSSQYVVLANEFKEIIVKKLTAKAKY